MTTRTTARSKAEPKSESNLRKAIAAKGIQKKLDEAAEEVKTLKAQIAALETKAQQRLEEYNGKDGNKSSMRLDGNE